MAAMASTPEPIQAATLVLIRDRNGRPPELLMIERAAGMAFAAGALVFPGGRIEAGDAILAAVAPALDAADAAARVAAIRETIEEVGIAVGILPAPDQAMLAGLRAGLAGNEPFGALLAGRGLSLYLAALCPFARWLPRGLGGRVYDTRFYLAVAPADASAVADGGESVRAVWTGAQAALDDAGAGRHRIIFPTRRNLERLALAGSHADACADAARQPIAIVTPWIERRAGEDWLCIRADQGYPVTAEPLATAQRG